MGIRNRVISPFYISHPVTLLTYFTALLSCIFIFKNPLFTAVAFIVCCILAIYYAGFDRFLKSVRWIVPIGVLVLILNTILVHRGSTVLFYFLYNPITKEAMIYGIYNMFMLMSVMTAFISFNALIDSTRFLYLFSNVLPKTSFVFDMALRYIPLFKKRASDLSAVQNVNNKTNQKNIKDKITKSGTYLKALTAWTLEEGMDTALSLKVKNYGTRKKVHYARYRYTIRDIILTVIFLSFSVFIYINAFLGETDFVFYPVTDRLEIKGYTLIIFLTMTVTIFFPFILEGFTAIKRGCTKIWLQKH